MTIPSEGDRNLFDNQEHQEARQNDVRQSDIEFFSKLGEKDLAKFYAIEQAMQLLTENGVHVQMLAFLKSGYACGRVLLPFLCLVFPTFRRMNRRRLFAVCLHKRLWDKTNRVPYHEKPSECLQTP